MLVLCSEEEFDDNEDNVVLSEMIDGDDKVEEPQNSMSFSSHEEVISYYKTYARQVSFGVLKRVIKKRPDGKPFYMVLTCMRDGQERNSRSTGVKTKLLTTKTGCNARICANV